MVRSPVSATDSQVVETRSNTGAGPVSGPKPAYAMFDIAAGTERSGPLGNPLDCSCVVLSLPCQRAGTQAKDRCGIETNPGGRRMARGSRLAPGLARP